MKPVQGKLYQVWNYDLLGNEENGYEVNDRFKGEKVFVPNKIIEAYDKIFINYLIEQGIITLLDNADINDISIDGESDYTIYFMYRGDPVFEMEKLADLNKKVENGIDVFYNPDGTESEYFI